MKRGLLFSAAVLMMAASAMAQTDITPSRYKFADQPVGSYLIDGYNDGWGPSNAAAAKLSEVGYVNLTGSTPYSTKDKPASIAFQSGLQIVDFTAEGVGKVLCFVGNNFSDGDDQSLANKQILAKAKKASALLGAAQWPQLGFYSDFAKTPTGAGNYIRVSITFKAIVNADVADAVKGPINQLELKAASGTLRETYKGLAKGIDGNTFGSIGMMMDPEDEDYALNEGWQKVEYDFIIPEAAGSPFTFSLKLSNETAGDLHELDNGAFLIKEIKFMSDVDGTLADPAVTKEGINAAVKMGITLPKPAPTGINTDIAENNKIICAVSDNILSVSNLKAGEKVEVYSITGALIGSQLAASNVVTLPLTDKGFYIVRVGSSSVKVANN